MNYAGAPEGNHEFTIEHRGYLLACTPYRRRGRWFVDHVQAVGSLLGESRQRMATIPCPLDGFLSAHEAGDFGQMQAMKWVDRQEPPDPCTPLLRGSGVVHGHYATAP